MLREILHSGTEGDGPRFSQLNSENSASGVMFATLRLRLQFLLFSIDIVSISIAIVMAGYIWTGRVLANGDTEVIFAFVPFFVLTSLNGGAYEANILSRRFMGAWRGSRSVLMACMCVILSAFFLKAGDQISRMVLLIGGVSGAILVPLLRGVVQTWILHRYGSSLRSEVLLLDDCEADAPLGVSVIRVASIGLKCDLNDPIMLDRIGRIFAPVDRVVIACSLERRRNWALLLKGANVHAELLTPELTGIGPLGTGRFGSSATVVVAGSSLNLRQRALKRGLDVVLAIFLITLLIPFFVVVSIAVKLDSNGPIFFVQQRIGRGNRLFGIYKFRSMRSDVSDKDGSLSTSRDDDRITRIGRIIRNTSIDEIPQLINILKGQMSFVGPRPHALGSLAGNLLFWEVDERYWHRHVCKPGLTGLAQIRGFRGATIYESDLTNRLQADLEYANEWTIFRDLSILLSTFRVIMHRNAF